MQLNDTFAAPVKCEGTIVSIAIHILVIATYWGRTESDAVDVSACSKLNHLTMCQKPYVLPQLCLCQRRQSLYCEAGRMLSSGQSPYGKSLR